MPPLRGRGLVGPLLALLLAGSAACEGGSGEERTEAARSDSARSSTTSSLLENPPEAPAQEPQTVRVVELGHDSGDPQAPVYVVEFSDFGCGYCRQFHLDTWPTLREDFVSTGKVGWKLIPFVSGMFENSRAATVAAECAADQGRFPEMGERLFQDQPTWKPSPEPGEHFEGYAREIGLDLERFRGCVETDARGDRIDRANRAATRLGVRATPTFYIDGFPVQGALPETLFREIFRIQLGEKEPPGG